MKPLHRLARYVVISAAVARGILRALLVGVVLVSCSARLPPVSGCTPFEQSCIGDAPHVCSASRRQEPAGDLSCSATGGRCVVSDAGVAHCAPLGVAR